MVNYESAPNKKAKLVLETTAFRQSRSDLNVAFSTADKDTGIFEFTVTQNGNPLLLGDSNVKTSIVYVHSNGLSIREDLDITDGLNGKISTLVPNDILCSPGKVTSQVYVAVKGKEAIVAERIFSFTIEKSLMWEFDAETKLNYIIEFDELETLIKQRIYNIEQAMKNQEDYVAKIDQARDKGLSDIEIAKTNSVKEINDLADTKLNELTTKSSQYASDLNNINDSMQGKIDKFNTDVQPSNYVKQTDTTNWQKYAFTDSTGKRQYLGTLSKSVHTLSAGFYEAIIPGNNTFDCPLDPGGAENSYFAEINVTEGNSSRKVIELIHSDFNIVYRKTIHTNGVPRDWKNPTLNMETTQGAQSKADTALNSAKSYADSKFYDTGWQSLPLMSGFVNDDSLGFSVYRIKNDICEIIFNMKVTKDILSTGSPFLTLPDQYLPKYTFSFLARTNGTLGKNPVKCSYDTVNKIFKVWQNNNNTMAIGDYIYGHLTYLVG